MPAASQFHMAEKFNADLSEWDVAKGTDFDEMVRIARPRGGVTTKQLARAATGAVSLAHRRAPATSQFSRASSFNADLLEWKVAEGSNVEYMVRAARPRGSTAAPVATAHTDSPPPFRF